MTQRDACDAFIGSSYACAHKEVIQQCVTCVTPQHPRRSTAVDGNSPDRRPRRRPLSARLHSLGGQAKNGAYDRDEERQLAELLDLFDGWVRRRRLEAHNEAAS